jgi:hypothetical protein
MENVSGRRWEARLVQATVEMLTPSHTEIGAGGQDSGQQLHTLVGLPKARCSQGTNWKSPPVLPAAPSPRSPLHLNSIEEVINFPLLHPALPPAMVYWPLPPSTLSTGSYTATTHRLAISPLKDTGLFPVGAWWGKSCSDSSCAASADLCVHLSLAPTRRAMASHEADTCLISSKSAVLVSFHHCDKTPVTIILKGEQLFLAHGFCLRLLGCIVLGPVGRQSIMVGRS